MPREACSREAGLPFEGLADVLDDAAQQRIFPAAAALARVKNFVYSPKNMDAEIEARIVLREKARKDKDFARADEIRAELKEQGIILMDTPRRREVEEGINLTTTTNNQDVRSPCDRNKPS